MSTKELKAIEKSLATLWNSALGKAVMRDLRDHSSISKEAKKKFEDVEIKLDEIRGKYTTNSLFKFGISTIITVCVLFVAGQWGVTRYTLNNFKIGIDQSFMVQVDYLIESDKKQNEEIALIKEKLYQLTK